METLYNNMRSTKFHAKWKDIELSMMKDPPTQAILAHTNLDIHLEMTENP